MLAASAMAVIVGGGLWTATAAAQLFKEPFTFTNRNPEGMAIYMRQRDDANGQGTGTAVAGSAGETLLCGAGTGTTTGTAAGNIMCVLAGSGANVLVGSEQDNDGGHSADADTNTTAADEIGEILYGDGGSQ